MAAAALVLQNGGGRKLMLKIGWIRFIGTIGGLITSFILMRFVDPHGLLLIAILFALRYVTEMSVMRNYAIALLFITPSSLLTVFTLSGMPDWQIALFRGLDTFLGVACAAVVLFTVATSMSQWRLPEALKDVLDESEKLLDRLATGDMHSATIQQLQEALRRKLIAVTNAYDTAINESSKVEKNVTSLWANVVRVQRLGFDILTAGQSARQGGNLRFNVLREQIDSEKKRVALGHCLLCPYRVTNECIQEKAPQQGVSTGVAA
jgi:uncharacterized membrane protein YccC